MKLASRSSRLLGQIIDGIIAVTPIGVCALVLNPEGPGSTGLIFISVIFAPGYYLFADALPGGQSWGKQLLGLAVVDKESSAPCSIFQSFVRNILQPILGILDWIFIFGSERRRLGDMAAGTIVVEKSETLLDWLDR